MGINAAILIGIHLIEHRSQLGVLHLCELGEFLQPSQSAEEKKERERGGGGARGSGERESAGDSEDALPVR